MSIWDEVCKRFRIANDWYYHWIYRDDCNETCYEEIYVDRCNQIIIGYLQEVV